MSGSAKRRKRVELQKLIVILVGLPARGKTFLCNKLMCYLNWWVLRWVLRLRYKGSGWSGRCQLTGAGWLQQRAGDAVMDNRLPVRLFFLLQTGSTPNKRCACHSCLDRPQAGPPHQALQRGAVPAAGEGRRAPGTRQLAAAASKRAGGSSSSKSNWAAPVG